MILGTGPALKQQLAGIVEDEDGKGPVKQPPPVRLHFLGKPDFAVIGVNQDDSLNARCLHSLVLRGKADVYRRQYTDKAPATETTGASEHQAHQVAASTSGLSLRAMPTYILILFGLEEGWRL